MRKIWFEVKFILKTILRLFFSIVTGNEECIVCGRKTLIYPICKKCFKEKFSVESAFVAERCKSCGKELVSLKEICLECRESVVFKHTDFVFPIFSYRLWNKELMFMWKSLEERSLSYLFAELFYDALKKLGVSVVVPVPPRAGKIQKEGWDQIDEVCNFLEFKYGIKILRILERRGSHQQKKLNRDERLDTIGKSYFPVSDDKMKRKLMDFGGVLPEKLCIIDDVCTTGATLESCARVLKEGGAKYVSAVTLFVVD